MEETELKAQLFDHIVAIDSHQNHIKYHQNEMRILNEKLLAVQKPSEPIPPSSNK